MKHFTIRLVDAGRQTHQWSLWTETLTVGSDPRNRLVLPAPAARNIGSYGSDATVALPFGELVVEEDTRLHARLWELARERIARSRALVWRDPGERGRNARAGVFAALGGVFFFALGAVWIASLHPPRPAPVDIGEILVPLVPEPDPTKPVETPAVVEPEPTGSETRAADPNQAGSSETRTIAHPPNSPAGVMAGSVMARANTNMGDLLGHDVEPDAPNLIDAIVAGEGSLRGANATGRAGDGDDRMPAIGGIGLGDGGRAGIGRGRGAIPGNLRLGTAGHGTDGLRPRPVVHAPRPSDLELGGETGTRSPESILRVIRQHVGGFRYAYEKALKERPDLGGKIALRFTIAPSGDITAIEIVSSSTGDPVFDEGIKDKAKRMRFDAIERGNVTVAYAFVLDRQ